MPGWTLDQVRKVFMRPLISAHVTKGHNPHQYPYGQDMPPEDFWNIAGRAGRVDQGDLGIIALAGNDEEKSTKLKAVR